MSINEYSGMFHRATQMRFCIIASRFNEAIVNQLIDGALQTLKSHGVCEENISLVRVPGAFEIPLIAKKAALSGDYDALICLGAVIRGMTPHFGYVAGQAASGIHQASIDSNIPVIFGVLTTDSLEQAWERAGTKAGNKGRDAALNAIEMADLIEQLKTAMHK